MAQRAIDDVELSLGSVKGPESDCVVVNCHELRWVSIEKGDILAALVWMVGSYLQALALPLCHVPDNHEVPVNFAAERDQVGIVAGEGKALDPLLVKLNSVKHLMREEVPDYQGRLKASVAKLLPRRKELS
jgi:hypothetical protein